MSLNSDSVTCQAGACYLLLEPQFDHRKWRSESCLLCGDAKRAAWREWPVLPVLPRGQGPRSLPWLTGSRPPFLPTAERLLLKLAVEARPQ